MSDLQPAKPEVNEVAQEQHPQDQGPRPPFPEQAQAFPSQVESMVPAPDHGEETYRGSGKLEGKVALITGADSGIGRAVALAFAREGADILIAYFNERADAEKTQEWVEAAGRRSVTAAADVRDETSCQQLVQKALDEFGHLDILVNNAAYQMTYTDITSINSNQFDRHFQTNVYGMFYLCRAAIPVMKPGSVIINTASTQAFRPSVDLLPYAATQGAIVSFSKSLAKMVIEQGIRVNVVAPGPVWTPMIAYSHSVEEVQNFGSTTPMGRPAQPAEIAPLYVLLASPEASYITGSVYEITGGRTV